MKSVIYIFGLAAVFVPQLAFAIGVSPATMDLENILPSSKIERTLIINRGDAEKDETVLIEIEGDEYITYDYVDLENFVLPAGENQTEFNFVINTNDLEPGDYMVKFVITPDIDITLAGSMTAPSVSTDLTFSVSESVVEDYTVDKVVMKEFFEGGSLDFSYNISNSGNVPVEVDEIQVDITDQNDPNFSLSKSLSNHDVIAPFSDEVFVVNSGISLAPSHYDVSFRFLDSFGNIMYTNTLFLQVMPELEGHFLLYLLIGIIFISPLSIIALRGKKDY